jgi:ribose transport system substrate-binding protein
VFVLFWEQQPIHAGRLSNGKLAPAKIAIVMRSVANPYFIEMERSARKAESELGVNIIIRKVNQEINPQEQIDILHDLAKDDIDGLIIDPVDSMALLPIIKQYQSAGIPVVNVDCELDRASMLQLGMTPPPFVGIDNENAGFMVAEYLSNKIKEPTNVVIIEGKFSSMLSDQRKRGALLAFAKNPCAVLKLQKEAYWDKQQAYITAKNLYNDFEHIGCFFCVDDVMACGVIQYLIETKRNDVLVSGFGDLKAAELFLEQRKLTITVAERAGRQIQTAIGYTADMLNEKKVPGETFVDFALIDAGMINER